jgi:alkanesulfonate monooxygenase SsuD/methylene tetrahydromethanopterin reductase-like flavin-dependent oxidoreductase (luciferase family)
MTTSLVNMPDGTFRFGVIGAPSAQAQQWRATARRAAELGYTTLLMPDVLTLLAPGPSLGVAAGAADIGVGTWVYSAPLRTPQQTAWEAHTLTVLTEGRFEMGVGTGQPRSREFAATLGLPFRSAAERLATVSETIDAVRALDGPDLRTPVLLAAGGPKARALAAEKADIVTIAAGPLTPREGVAAAVAEVRETAGGRAGAIEFAMNLFAVGDRVPPYAQQATGATPEQLIAADSLVLLRGDSSVMTDELRHRREQLGVSYILVNAEFMDALAPVVELLTGT